MKRKLYVIFGLLIAFLLFVAIRIIILKQQNVQGRMKVLSTPSATVFVDNIASGKTPFETALAPGEYKIKLIPEGEGNRITWEGAVKINKNSLTFVSRELGTKDVLSGGEILTVEKMETRPGGNTGQISVETEPAGAIVYLDNKQRGVSPLILDSIPEGEHELSVFYPGFFRRTQKINVEKGYVVNAEFKLGLDESYKTVEEELEKAREENASQEAKLKEENDSDNTTSQENTVTILVTPTGYLNVRAEASLNADVVDQVTPGDVFEYTDAQNNWFYIIIDEETEGWVFGDYVQVNE